MPGESFPSESFVIAYGVIGSVCIGGLVYSCYRATRQIMESGKHNNDNSSFENAWNTRKGIPENTEPRSEIIR